MASNGYSASAALAERKNNGFYGTPPKPYHLQDMRKALADALEGY